MNDNSPIALLNPQPKFFLDEVRGEEFMIAFPHAFEKNVRVFTGFYANGDELLVGASFFLN